MANNLIEWSILFEISPEIDEQHKKLCSIINELHTAYINVVETCKLANIIKELHDYTIYHFKTEEDLFENYNYSNIEKHKLEHKLFVDKINEFIDRFNEDDSMLTFDMLDYLKNWLLDHILDSDKKYKSEIFDNK